MDEIGLIESPDMYSVEYLLREDNSGVRVT